MRVWSKTTLPGGPPCCGRCYGVSGGGTTSSSPVVTSGGAVSGISVSGASVGGVPAVGASVVGASVVGAAVVSLPAQCTSAVAMRGTRRAGFRPPGHRRDIDPPPGPGAVAPPHRPTRSSSPAPAHATGRGSFRSPYGWFPSPADRGTGREGCCTREGLRTAAPAMRAMVAAAAMSAGAQETVDPMGAVECPCCVPVRPSEMARHEGARGDPPDGSCRRRVPLIVRQVTRLTVSPGSPRSPRSRVHRPTGTAPRPGGAGSPPGSFRDPWGDR